MGFRVWGPGFGCCTDLFKLLDLKLIDLSVPPSGVGSAKGGRRPSSGTRTRILTGNCSPSFNTQSLQESQTPEPPSATSLPLFAIRTMRDGG